MTTQTILGNWQTPDGEDRYIIPSSEWQKGQAWARHVNHVPGITSRPSPASTVIIVPEIYDILEPRPEVVWLDGLPIAMHNTLPLDTKYRWLADGASATVTGADHHSRPVIVVAWPDGSKPVQPSEDLS